MTDSNLSPAPAKPLFKPQELAGQSIDNALQSAVQLLRDSARSLDRDGADAPFVNQSAARRLRQLSDYLDAQQGGAMIEAGLDFARQHPRLVVSAISTLTATGLSILLAMSDQRQSAENSEATR